jgi:hypothetical protein
MITVITSIPPSSPKRVIDEKIFETSYRDACIDSWKKLGAEIITINSFKEYDAVKAGIPQIKVIGVDSDGTAVTGKPLILFYDLIKGALATNSEVFVITNADIFFSHVSQISDIIHKMQPKDAIVARRVNVESLNASLGSSYRWGYDLFVVHREDLNMLCPDRDLYFGDPWWDWRALCNLVFNGINITCLDSSHVLHLLHKDAFTFDRLAEIGNKQLPKLFKIVNSQSYDNSTATAIKLAEIIHKFERMLVHYKQINMSNLQYEIDISFHHRFTLVLTHFAEQIIGFNSSSPEQISLACDELKCALEGKN